MRPMAGAITRLEVPNLDLRGSLDAARALWALPVGLDYVIDFSNTKWMTPFGMLYFARQLRTFADKRKPSRCRAVGYQKHGYAAHMGFFQTFGLDFGNVAGEAPGSAAYVPITELNVRSLHIEAGQSQREVQEVIETHCAKLAAVLSRDSDGPLTQTLTFCLREIFRNVTEHSNSDSIWYAAQYWPDKQLVELSILDQGQGVRSSLSRNPHLNIGSDYDALNLAMLPGISGRAFAGGPKLRDDEWANSGYGLFMTSQICARGGSFAIFSGDAGILMKGGEGQSIPVDFAGTALRLCIFVPEVQSLNVALAELNQRGSEIAVQADGLGAKTASMSSRMLSRDFSAK